MIEYKAVSVDAKSTDMVQVEETKTQTVKTVYTLQALDTEINVIGAQITRLQERLAELNALRNSVFTEASKVEIKKSLEEVIK